MRALVPQVATPCVDVDVAVRRADAVLRVVEYPAPASNRFVGASMIESVTVASSACATSVSIEACTLAK
jgi:hypothetical protein